MNFHIIHFFHVIANSTMRNAIVNKNFVSNIQSCGGVIYKDDVRLNWSHQLRHRFYGTLHRIVKFALFCPSVDDKQFFVDRDRLMATPGVDHVGELQPTVSHGVVRFAGSPVVTIITYNIVFVQVRLLQPLETTICSWKTDWICNHL